jgi:hypothetical protein
MSLCVLYMKILLTELSLLMFSNIGCVLYMNISLYADCWGWRGGEVKQNCVKSQTFINFPRDIFFYTTAFKTM